MPNNPEQIYQTIKSEGLKSLAGDSLHILARSRFGRSVIEQISGGDRVADPRLHVELAGMSLENPLLVGAGWDEDGRLVDGLYALGFAGTEVGTVTVKPQHGNPKPRLFIDETVSVGLNSMGFNGPGKRQVRANLAVQNRLGIVGISLGKNKLTPAERVPWEHADVAGKLYDYADYFVINAASPNTPGLRDYLNPEPLSEIITAVQQEIRDKGGGKPLFVKTTIDLTTDQLDSVLDVCQDLGVNGIIDTNTTTNPELLRAHGWEGMDGGLSGNDETYRVKATERMRHITERTRDNHNFYRIGVGGINDTETALDRIRAGAQVLQIVTGIRYRRGPIARNINLGLIEAMARDGVKDISEYVDTAL